LASKSFLKQVCHFGLFKKQPTAEKNEFLENVLQAIESIAVCCGLHVFWAFRGGICRPQAGLSPRSGQCR
jgi:hypothetical protein